MRETIFLRVGKHDDYPLPESLRPIARDRDSCWDFEHASDDPRWGDILEFCALQADRERARDEERQMERARLGLPRFWLPGGDELDAAIKNHIVSRGWTIPPDLPYYWVRVRRHYAPRELRAAEALHWFPWWTTSYKRPYEMNREIYDWDRQCRMCLATPQKAPLLFTSQWFPRSKDVVRVSSRNEVLVSERFAGVIEDTRVTGCATRSVFERRPRLGFREVPGWRQLVITSDPVPVAPSTVFGRDIFHPDRTGRGRCTVCPHTREDRLLSELYLQRDGWTGADIALTRDRIGGRMGWPVQLLVISPRFHRLLVERAIKGYALEVAHLV